MRLPEIVNVGYGKGISYLQVEHSRESGVFHAEALARRTNLLGSTGQSAGKPSMLEDNLRAMILGPWTIEQSYFWEFDW
jgi:hypothetical protein